jgi:prepilin-type N-terminal cleavage/methylation domain-containing protein
MRNRGYTLVELLVVTSVSVLLVTGVVTLYATTYVELRRETERADEAAGYTRFETTLRRDLRCLARGTGIASLHLDVTGDTCLLQLNVLDTSSTGLPAITGVSYLFEKGSDMVVYTRASEKESLRHPGAFEDLLAIDSIGRQQGVWFWDDILPKGLTIRIETPDTLPGGVYREMFFFIPR